MTKILDFTIGAKIYCRDGPAGILRYVVVDPHSRRVIDLITEKGFLQKEDRVLPIAIVERATPTEIYLAIHSSELAHYPEYRDIAFKVPAPGWEPGSTFQRQEIRHWANQYGPEGAIAPIMPQIKKHQVQGIATDLEAIGRNTPVRNRDGFIGKIDHVLIDQETQTLSHLVVQKGMVRHALVIPVDWIDIVDDEGVTIRGGRAELHQLSHIVSDETDGQEAERLRPATPGMIDGEQTRETGSIIVARVADALAVDPRTHLAVIEVINEHGVVTLSGNVESAAVRTAAQEIAAAQPGVMVVINALEVPPHEGIDSWGNPFAATHLVTP